MITAAATSCNKLDLKGLFMPTGEGVEKRFEHSAKINADLNAGSVNTMSEYTFYACTDPHINKTYRNLETFNNTLRNDRKASFGVILGDCCDIRDNIHTYLGALSFDSKRHLYDYDIFHILGNHDIFFNGWVQFRENVGASVYWFETIFPDGKDLYLSLDTATGTLGKKQTEWLKSFLMSNRQKYRHCIVLTHTNFFYTDTSQGSSGNMPIEETLSLVDFFGRQNVSLVLQGHDHFREDLIFDNVRYTVIGSIRDEFDAPEYLKIIVKPDEIVLDWQLI